jgi:Adenylate and Guanylate cyclase catalytic domain
MIVLVDVDFFTQLPGLQVTQEVYKILSERGYKLTCRGPVDVKGKGEMVTYLLTDADDTS